MQVRLEVFGIAALVLMWGIGLLSGFALARGATEWRETLRLWQRWRGERRERKALRGALARQTQKLNLMYEYARQCDADAAQRDQRWPHWEHGLGESR